MKWVIYENDELMGICKMKIYENREKATIALNKLAGTHNLLLPTTLGTPTGAIVGRSKLQFERLYGDVEKYLEDGE